MDPADWPLWVKLACGWGPLGIWAVRAEIARARAEREHHRTRDAQAKVIEAVEERYRNAQRETDAAHREQLEDVTNRMVKIVEAQSRKANVLADGVKERVRKKRKGDQNDDGQEDDGEAAS